MTKKSAEKGFTPLESKGHVIPKCFCGESTEFRFPPKTCGNDTLVERHRSLTGFTLIELMAGMGFFAFALLGLLALMGQSLELGHFSSNRTIALNEVRQVIEDVRRVADTSGLATMVSTNFNKTISDDILKSGSITVTDTAGATLQNNADPLSVRIKISWNEKGKTVSYTVDTKVTDR